MRRLLQLLDLLGLLTLLLVLMANAQGEDTLDCQEAGGECIPEDQTVNCIEYLPVQGCDDSEICCITPHFEERGSEVDCKEAGGECVPEDQTVNCLEYLPLQGCDVNEICCATPHFDQRGTCESIKPPVSCKKEYGGICQTECSSDRINVGNCTDVCKCCGCKIKRQCTTNGGFCVKENTACEGQRNDNWCTGKKCSCCIPDCPNSNECLLEGGRCAQTCRENEDPEQNIKCPNDGCVCCLPKISCQTTAACAAVKGRCDVSCFANEIQTGTNLCEGRKCFCCAPPPEPCPANWILNGGFCYYVSSDTLQQPDARRMCQNAGGDLVSILSQAEQDIVKSYTGNKFAWCGYSDIAVEGTFVWSDGSPVTFQNWNTGEPNNLADEDCTEMLYNGRWNDLPCNIMKYYVCKKRRA